MTSKLWWICCWFFLMSANAQGKKEQYVTADLGVGQLGNQMFQIATALAYSWDHGYRAIFPDLVQLKREGIPFNKEKFFFRLDSSGTKTLCSHVYCYLEKYYKPIPPKPNVRLVGLFFSYKYFDHYREKICQMLSPKQEDIERIKTQYQHLLRQPKIAAIHVRTYHPNLHNTFPFLGRNYFETAVRLFDEDTLFIICSDRIAFCKEYFAGLAKNMVFIEDGNYVDDFILLSLCPNIIISNSTFSWWAAYMNPHMRKKVVAPSLFYGPNYKYWPRKDFSSLYPKDWIIVPVAFSPQPETSLVHYPTHSLYAKEQDKNTRESVRRREGK